MEKFIDKVVGELLSTHRDLENLTIVIPGNRPKLFFQNSFRSQIRNSILPKFISIDDFIRDISGLQSISQIQLWFQAYESYLKITEEPDSFDVFLKWIPTLLKDFDDINTSLVDSKEIFDYLVSSERIKKWGHDNLEIGSNQLMSKHLFFWKMARDLFLQLNSDLLAKGKGYRGLIYLKAVENLPQFIDKLENEVVFIGLNALSNAEKKIVFDLEKSSKAQLYWDSDKYYLEDFNQEAGQFLREYKENSENWKWSFDHFSKPKNIEVVSISKQVGQAKYLHQILDKIPEEEWSETVVVLAEESLLPSVLSSIPAKISKVNITMGFPLNKSSMAYFFRTIFELQMNREKLGKGRTYYYKNVIDILGNTLFKENSSLGIELKNKIQSDNRIFTTPEFLQENLNDSIFKDLFEQPSSIMDFVNRILSWIKELMAKAEVQMNELDKEYLYRFSLLFTQLKEELGDFQGIQDFRTLFVLYNKLLQNETISFVGEPLEGLQIVGLLETRLLDFKNVIMTSVNDGIIPPGRVENSFIPFDIRREMGLYTYSENDAVFAYHFYRLLQRAENVHLLYNSEADAMGAGEKSRFITQIQIESGHELKFKVAAPRIDASALQKTKIEKTPSVMEALYNWTQKGISPSSLNAYLRNPLDFYQRYVLGLEDFEEAEEIVGARIMGNIVHETLEVLYKPLLQKVLIPSDFEPLLEQINAVLEEKFQKHYKSGEYKSGKNLLIYKIAETFVENVLKNDQRTAAQAEFVLWDLEKKSEVKFHLNDGREVKLKGVIDRIDSLNGKKRIIDYKTGSVKVESLRIKEEEFAKIFLENKKDKALQLLFYAYLYFPHAMGNETAQFGIYPLKFPKKDLLLLENEKQTDFSHEIIEQTREYLSSLIEEILNPEIPFEEEREPLE